MRQALARALVGLAALLLVGALVAVWADHLLLGPGHWESTSTQLLANPTIRTDTATYLADQIETRLDLARLPDLVLDSTFGAAAGTSAATVRATIFHDMYNALGTPAVEALWAQANLGAASAVLTAVDRQSGPASTTDAPVTVSLGPILRAAAGDAGLPAAVIAQLPASTGTLTLVRSDQVHTVQTAGRTIRDVTRVLVIVVPLLWLIALALARGRRRRTLAWIGISATLAAAVVLGARALLVTPVANSVSADPSLRSDIAAVITTVTGTLGHLAEIIGAVGLIVGVIAGLAGLGAGNRRRPGRAWD